LNPGRLARRLARRARRDPLLREIAGAASEVRARVFLVGGTVRDAALGAEVTDLDLVSDRGFSRLVSRLQEMWRTRGFRFRKRGVTTWRFSVGGREVDLVDATRRGLLEDLRRRDFTINAIAYDLLENEVVDPLGGLRDFRLGRLDLPRPGVIREDPVRALRAARFLAELPRFRLGREARREAALVAHLLPRAPVERIRPELDRLLASPAPSRGLRAMDSLGSLSALLPELGSLRSCAAGKNRPDVWRHTLEAIARSEKPGRLPGGEAMRTPEGRLAVRWALLLHDIAKPDTLVYRDGRPTFYGHELLGSRKAERLLRRLGAPRSLRRRVSRLVALHLRPSLLAEAGCPPRGMRRLAREAGEELPLLAFHAACDALGSGEPGARRRWARLRKALLALLEEADQAGRSDSPPLVTGDDVMSILGIPEGPLVGQVLEDVREAQASGAIRTRAEALSYLRDRKDARNGPARRS